MVEHLRNASREFRRLRIPSASLENMEMLHTHPWFVQNIFRTPFKAPLNCQTSRKAKKKHLKTTYVVHHWLSLATSKILQVVVSYNGRTLKIICFDGIFHYKPAILGYPHFRKPLSMKYSWDIHSTSHKYSIDIPYIYQKYPIKISHRFSRNHHPHHPIHRLSIIRLSIDCL